MCSTARYKSKLLKNGVDFVEFDNLSKESSASMRVQSCDMERLREDEETQARDRWKNIISFCTLAGTVILMGYLSRGWLSKKQIMIRDMGRPV